MSIWTEEEVGTFASADDFHVSPLREDGKTFGTPTFIWSVVADGELYIRPYHGRRSRWYQAAVREAAGRIRIGGAEYDVTFAPADDTALTSVDDAYRAKYRSSAYLAPMIAPGPRSRTLRVTPDRVSA
ncbi:DUF2255 family protein [Microbacterium sp. NPDC056569]|uniref:DUF2255 family protein n=1 Tax=Microbacterium sp. NPDC056569 TaxID=3345867 RepID=UPI00366A69D0